MPDGEADAEPVESEEQEPVVAELEPVVENHVAVEVAEAEPVVDEEPADEEPVEDDEPVEAAAANGEWTYTPMSDWGLDDRR